MYYVILWPFHLPGSAARRVYTFNHNHNIYSFIFVQFPFFVPSCSSPFPRRLFLHVQGRLEMKINVAHPQIQNERLGVRGWSGASYVTPFRIAPKQTSPL